MPATMMCIAPAIALAPFGPARTPQWTMPTEGGCCCHNSSDPAPSSQEPFDSSLLRADYAEADEWARTITAARARETQYAHRAI